jgi:nitrite reductase/ring-hydroxylating ferredoxin subunit
MALRNILDKVELTSGLDRIGDPVRRGAQAVLRGRLRDILQGVWLGHPLHPAMIDLPIGAWMSAAVLDAVPGAESAATVLVGFGTAGALPAAAAGLTDWTSLSTEQRRVGLVHATANAVALALYTGSLSARLRGRHGLGRRLAYAGFGVAGLGAYIGGHLSYRQAAQVNHAVPFLRLIPDGWHDLCDEHEVVEGRPIVRRIGEVPVLLARTTSGPTALVERCGHHAGPLGDGKVVQIDGADCVVCPLHGSTFRLADGVVMHGPAGSNQPLLRVRVQGGRIQVALP